MGVYVCSSIVEPSGFRVLGIVGALGDAFQQIKPSLSWAGWKVLESPRELGTSGLTA